jgi:hypothetical protein
MGGIYCQPALTNPLVQAHYGVSATLWQVLDSGIPWTDPCPSCLVIAVFAALEVEPVTSITLKQHFDVRPYYVLWW